MGAFDRPPLRDATADLETGVIVKTTAPKVRAQALFRDRFVGVVRMGHSLSKTKITSSRYGRAGGHTGSANRKAMTAVFEGRRSWRDAR